MGRQAFALRHGWLVDPEDARTSHRRRLAVRIVKLVSKVGWECSPKCELVPGHHDECRLGFDEWVSDEVLEAAYRLADLMQSERGRFHREAAYRMARERSES